MRFEFTLLVDLSSVSYAVWVLILSLFTIMLHSTLVIHAVLKAAPLETVYTGTVA